MEGIKENSELLSEFKHPIKNDIEEQKLGLGFQNLDFADKAQDHKLLGDQKDGFSKNLSEMTVVGGFSGEEEGSELEFAIEMDERKREIEGGFDKDGNFKEEIEGESDQGGLGEFKDSGGENEVKIEEGKFDKGSVGDGNEVEFEGAFDKDRNFKEEIGGESDQGGLGGFKDSGGGNEVKIEEGKFDKGSVGDENEGESEGGDKEGRWCENEDRDGDRGLEGFINEAKIDESGKFTAEGNGGDFMEMKEGGKVKEGSKWSEIENEFGDLEGVKDEVKNEERNPEKRSVVEGSEGGLKEMKEGDSDKEGVKWSEIEDAEYRYSLEVKNKWVDKGKKVIGDFEDGWGETWDDNAGRTEGDDELQYFNNSEDERNANEQYGEVPYWYGNAEGNSVRMNGKEQFDEKPHWSENAKRDSVGLNDGTFGSYLYPLRPDAEDCSFFMRTGTCKYGSNCKFNHPLKKKNQAARDTFKPKEEFYDSPGQTECKYYLSSGGCKYGKACRYNHGKGKAAVTPNLELNFLGLPIRVGEKECLYYMKNGSCKYGSNCRFHHPDPTVAGGGHTASPVRGGTSARTLNKTAPFRPVIYPLNPSAPPNAEWNRYQAPVYPTPGRNLPIPPGLAMDIPATGSNFYAHSRSQPMVDEFPERPGQPECKFYLKTGDCKYRSSCKFNHPKTLKTPVTRNEEGLPLRPGQSICSHFSRFGICKFGPSF
ncbi:zinc finger CCCH domain-containing protein 67-like [Heracleum sosnowskyi]|uniref:Zinc finger CCCH domain-containing protein 67-like n=1 Tax=Heracleum sosnowskyi TaxID=360622 RepID=A0AAD8H8N7_9APIA|nr:zinc finger CCCH domain-containing protein 67-like [Heracleum sosnowskyi]